MDLSVQDNGVAVLTMSFGPKGGNLFCPSLIAELDKIITAVESDARVSALVITGKGKYFSNGLNTKWLQKNVVWAPAMVISSYRLFARVLALGVPTIAAINGYAVGAGFFLALCCDHRIMVKGKASTANKKSQADYFLCLPELDLKMPLSPGYTAIAKCKLPKRALRTTVLTAKRWTPMEALSSGIIDRVVSSKDLLHTCVAFGHELAGGGRVERKRNVYSMLKREIYSECYESLTSWFAMPRMVATLGSLAVRGIFLPKKAKSLHKKNAALKSKL
mmetsp:Transcript_9290/g.14878  ORF Transcript_9290/g.14878 Transcript_9290/m.14878 type:complete len:276 (-) Transcript_9290:189-1016(-)